MPSRQFRIVYIFDYRDPILMTPRANSESAPRFLSLGFSSCAPILLPALLSVFLLLPAISDARPPDQRQTFIAAEDALKDGRRDEFIRLSLSLEDYPLFPYLVFMDLRQSLSPDLENQVQVFIETYSDTPLANQLRAEWLDHLAKNREWERLARDFAGPVDAATHCSYARALLETGQQELAWQEAEKLWLHGHSRPDQCDPVFDQWRKNDKLSPELVRRRIELSMNSGQTGLARYLQRYLPAEDRKWARLWLDVAARPETVLDIDWDIDQDNDWPAQAGPAAEKILHQAMNRLIRKDTVDALAGWRALQARHDLEAFDTDSVDMQIGLYLSLRKHPMALAYLADLDHEKMPTSLKRWHVRAAIYRQDWETVLKALDRLCDPAKNAPRWMYWRARAQDALGKNREAAETYLSITGRQNYFSLLAADRLNLPYSINHSPIDAPEADIAELKNNPGIRRAMELFHLGRTSEARTEWIIALRRKGPSANNAAAVLAYEMGWYDRAIMAAADAGSFDDIVIRFPMPYEWLFLQYGLEKNMDPGWLFAVARQESMFMTDVGSPAGALGIMQIMPATGRRVANMMGESFHSSHFLLVPEYNIRLGSFYLKTRLEALQNNIVLALAAYNAGTHRVNSWLPEDVSMPADIWLETIPFFETRDYVEKVLSHNAIYQMRLGRNPARLVSIMPDIAGTAMVAEQQAF